MKRSNWKLGALAAMAVAAATFVSQAQAATVSLNFTPAPINPGDAVGVDIVADGLPSASGGFSFLLDYGDLTFGGYTIGAGFGALPLDLGLGDLGGTVDMLVLADADPAFTEAIAFAAQNSGGAFTLAHFDFTAGAAGPFTFGLRDAALSNFKGEFDDPAFNLLGCTGAACGNQVPEPMTALLVAVALGGLGIGRWHRRAA